MPCSGCKSTNVTPKKPQYITNLQRPTGNVISLGGKLTFGKPKINRGK